MARRKKTNNTKRNRVERLRKEQDNKCYYCEIEFGNAAHNKPTQEHLIRACEGGTYGNGNIVLACGPCNHHRADHPVHYWKHDQYRLKVRQTRNKCENIRRVWKRKHIFFPIKEVVKSHMIARWLSNRIHRVIAWRCHIEQAVVVQYLRFKYRNEVEANGGL